MARRERVHRERPGMWQEREILDNGKQKKINEKRQENPARHSRDCDKPSDRLTGRQAGRQRIDLYSSVVANTLLEQRRGQGDTKQGIISPFSCTRCLKT